MNQGRQLRQSTLVNFFSRNSGTEDNQSASEDDYEEESKSVRDYSQEYITTKLLYQRNITVADVVVETITSESMDYTYFDLVADISSLDTEGFIIDPRKEVMGVKNRQIQDTLFTPEEIQALAQKALQLYSKYISSEHEPQSDQQQQPQVIGNSQPVEQVLPKRILKDLKKQRQRLLKQELQHKEAIHLYNQEKLTKHQIQKRLKLSYKRLQKYLNNPHLDYSDPQNNRKKREKFKKLHQRARAHIQIMLNTATVPLQLSDFQKSIRNNIQLNVSKSMIRMYIKEKLNLSYKYLKQISVNHNYYLNKLQRQVAAARYIEFLFQGKCLINIDESVLQDTDHRRRGWSRMRANNIVTHSQRLRSMNLIAGISNFGDFYYTVNHGKTNGKTFLYYLYNAPYHRSVENLAKYKDLGLPLMFLGPYQYKIAPIELMFSHIKNRDLNPLNTRAQSRGYWGAFMKELGMTLSHINQEVAKKCFFHVLTAALEALSLKDL